MLPLTAFISRERKCAEITQLLDQFTCRLVTIIGPGRTGKTRLATHADNVVADAFARGITVVYLQPIQATEFFAPAIADALGFGLNGADEPLEQLGHGLEF